MDKFGRSRKFHFLGAFLALLFIVINPSASSAAPQGVLQQRAPIGGNTCWLQNYAPQSFGYVFTVPASGAWVYALGARDQDKTYTVRLWDNATGLELDSVSVATSGCPGYPDNCADFFYTDLPATRELAAGDYTVSLDIPNRACITSSISTPFSSVGVVVKKSVTGSVGARPITNTSASIFGQPDVKLEVNNPVPSLTSIDPTRATVGDPDLILTVSGSNFVPNSVVRWGGSDLATTFVSATQLEAVIPAANFATAGGAQTSVFNPTPEGGVSGAADFTVDAVPPPMGGGGDAGNVTGWLWSGTAGWVSANCSNFGTCAASGYGLNLEDAEGLVGDQSTIGQLSGWAWSSNFGWICVGKTCVDANPEGLPNYADLREILPASAPFCTSSVQCGQMENCRFNKCIPKPRLYGWAQVIRLGSGGWISLNCDKDDERGGTMANDCANSEYHVLFDQGHMTLATPYEPLIDDPDNYHWSWGGNDNGTGIGWLDWSSVFADWAPADLGNGVVYRPEGIYEPAASWPAGQEASHPSAFEVTVASVSSPPGYRLECGLGLPNGEQRTFGEPIGTVDEFGVWTGAMTGGPMTLGYAVGQDDLNDGVKHADPAEDAIQQNRLWYLEGCRLCGKVVDDRLCAAEDDCPLGYVCDEDYGKCRKIIDSTLRKPIYVHHNTWTLFDDNEDYYQAIKCYAGFPGQYFENTGRCNFTADASFSLAMARGIPVKRDCHFFGVPDCEDRFCKGISYFCPATPARRPTTCVWSEAGTEGSLGQCSSLTYERGNLCCTKQPVSPGSSFSSVVNGMECGYGDPDDGYFDCDCGPGNSAKWGVGDCFEPGFEAGDLCCNEAGEVVKEAAAEEPPID